MIIILRRRKNQLRWYKRLSKLLYIPLILNPQPYLTSTHNTFPYNLPLCLNPPKPNPLPNTRDHHECVGGTIADGKTFLGSSDYGDLKLPVATRLHGDAGVIAEAFHAATAREELHAERGEHEHEEEKDDEGQGKALETQGQFVQHMAHARQLADETQWPKRSAHVQQPGDKHMCLNMEIKHM